MRDETFALIIVIMVVIMFFAFLLGIAYNFDKFSCKKVAKSLNYSCEYSIWTGCIIVKPDGSKALLEQLRDFNN